MRCLEQSSTNASYITVRNSTNKFKGRMCGSSLHDCNAIAVWAQLNSILQNWQANVASLSGFYKASKLLVKSRKRVSVAKELRSLLHPLQMSTDIRLASSRHTCHWRQQSSMSLSAGCHNKALAAWHFVQFFDLVCSSWPRIYMPILSSLLIADVRSISDCTTWLVWN